jgi:hypothetical protein
MRSEHRHTQPLPYLPQHESIYMYVQYGRIYTYTRHLCVKTSRTIAWNLYKRSYRSPLKHIAFVAAKLSLNTAP